MIAIDMTKPSTLAALLLGLGLATILGAWGFELIGGYIPCKLCLEQRDPYYYGLPLAFGALLGLRLGWPRPVIVALLVATAAVFLYGMSLGVYQAGAEWHFWQGPMDCGATRGAKIPTSAANLMESLNKVKIASCTEVQWRMFGLSFAGWNAAVSTALAGLGLFAAWRLARP